MAFLDVVFILILFGFLLFGYWFGFVHALGSAIGFIAALIVASHVYTMTDASFTLRVILFGLTYVIVNKLISLFFGVISKFISVVKIIPFTSMIDKIAGAIFGCAEGLFVLTVVVLLIVKYNVPGLDSPIADSFLYETVLRLGEQLRPYLGPIELLLF